MQHRVIFHIDMNSYFASCEQQANPHLRGRPVGVCEHLGGIIIAPSVEAKRLGIKTATPVWEAQKICPDIILLPVDPPKYREITRRFLKIFSEYTDLVERYSIDEAFLDVTDWIMSFSSSSRPKWRDSLPYNKSVGQEIPRLASLARNDSEEKCWRSALVLALEIKWRIRREIGEWLTCSIGAGPNKLVAKIASDLDKPDGVTIVSPKDVFGLYDHLRLTDVPGIAGRMQRRLNLLGIFSLKDLANYPESLLRINFGILGHSLHEMGNFRGGIELVTPAEETIKSMGHAYTLPRATADEKAIKSLLFKLSEKVAARLRRKNYWGSEVSCYVRFTQRMTLAGLRRGSSSLQSQGYGRSRRIHDFTNDGKLIFRQAWKLFDSFKISFPLRMAGVTVSGLAANVLDEPLFFRYKKQQLALAAQDSINGKYGDLTLRSAALVDALNLAPDTVGFGRMKEMS